MALAAASAPEPAVTRIVIAGVPLPKVHRYDRRGFAYLSPKVRRHEGHIRFEARRVMGDVAPFAGPVDVTVTAHVRIPTSWSKKKQGLAAMGVVMPTKRPDADNMGKAALDGCNGVVWRDDSQIVDLVLMKRYSIKPRLVIEVREIAAEAA